MYYVAGVCPITIIYIMAVSEQLLRTFFGTSRVTPKLMTVSILMSHCCLFAHTSPQLVMVRLPGRKVLLGLKKRGIGEGYVYLRPAPARSKIPPQVLQWVWRQV